MYRVRFHLAKGKHFMKWQVKSPDGTVKFYDPSEVEMRMFDCTLKNQPNGAKKIFDGANKFVVAWIEAEDVFTLPIASEDDLPSSCEDLTRVSYNPAVAPNWVLDGKNVDGEELSVIVSDGRSLYCLFETNEE